MATTSQASSKANYEDKRRELWIRKQKISNISLDASRTQTSLRQPQHCDDSHQRNVI